MFAPRLIHPVVAVLHRLDPAATWAVDPPGPPDSGFDPDFKEYAIYDDPGRTSARRERSPIEVRCQVEQESYETLVATFGGDSPVTDTVLVARTKELRAAGLIGSDGELDIPKGSRVSSILDPVTRQKVVKDFSDMYVFEARPRSWGYRDRMNLYVLYFYNRGQVGEV